LAPVTTVWVAFIVAFLVAIQSTRMSIVIARWGNVLDRPDGYRKTHLRPTPRLGGVGLFLAFAAPVVGLLLLREYSTVADELLYRKQQFIGLLVGSSLAVGLGVVDDVRELSAMWKLVFQLLIAAVVFKFGFQINAISNPFGEPFTLGLLSFPVTVLWFVGCMNAVNLLDGLDGLAAGTCLFVGLTLFIMCVQANTVLGMFLMASLSGAILGFLLFNFPPAKIFLGDSGSLLLGFLIAALSLVGASRKAEAAVALFIPVIALGLPIFDTSLAIVRRWYKRLPITAPDRQHIHHVLVSMGYSQQRVVLTLYLICVLLGAAALVITFARGEVVLLIIGSLVLMIFVSVRVVGGVGLRDVLNKVSQDSARRNRVLHSRVIVERGLHRLRDARTAEELWSSCVDMFSALGLEYALLLLDPAPGESDSRKWEWYAAEGGSSVPSGDKWNVHLHIDSGNGVTGKLLVGERVGKVFLQTELPEMMRRVRDELAAQSRRLAADKAHPVNGKKKS
jgi:UDP-GlcNAc:undecaprenyl-phosphate GlcNAc-1-phosphate transferase